MGVFIGISWTEYHQMASSAGVGVSAYTAQGAVLSVCPGERVLGAGIASWVVCLVLYPGHDTTQQ